MKIQATLLLSVQTARNPKFCSVKCAFAQDGWYETCQLYKRAREYDHGGYERCKGCLRDFPAPKKVV